jgi:hypothetical protein
MKLKPRKYQQTALQAFEAEHAHIVALLNNLPQQLREYDRDISSVPGGHAEWTHAGTLAHVREQLQHVMTELASARHNKRSRSARLAARLAASK